MFVFLDESGDPGFRMDKTSTRFFVIATVIVSDPFILDDAIDRFRAEIGYTRNPEFKAASTPPAIRERFLRAICQWDFVVRALVVDKQRVTEPSLQSSETLYDYFVAQLFDDDDDLIRDATIVLDESMKHRSAQKRAAGRLRRHLNRSSPQRVRQVRYRDSKGSNALQAADMVAYSIYHRYRHSDDRYYRIIQPRTRIWELGGMDDP
ncbi:MAG TPA: DUF3800 domain-containing protein [Thermomicrobiales bacterium]|nr:DUF3800 domain-containing protein [Thermomicrobiales bacterium]